MYLLLRIPVEALEDFKINCNHYKIILSDIRMPRMNGYEFVKKVKEIDKQVKTILMSAFEINDEELHNMLTDVKIDGFLQKPFSMAKLNDVIAKISMGTVVYLFDNTGKKDGNSLPRTISTPYELL